MNSPFQHNGQLFQLLCTAVTAKTTFDGLPLTGLQPQDADIIKNEYNFIQCQFCHHIAILTAAMAKIKIRVLTSQIFACQGEQR